MAQIVRTTNDLIIAALILTGELGVGEVPDAFMLETGLELINEILDGFSVDSIFIPYTTNLSFTMVPGKAVYSISDILFGSTITADRLVDLEFANYQYPVGNQNNLTYPIEIIDRAVYKYSTILSTLQSRPSTVWVIKQAEETLLTFYPAPDQAYIVNLQARSMLNFVTNQSTLITLPPFYYAFLKYALARRFIAVYPSANWPQTNEDQYQQYLASLKSGNEIDLSLQADLSINPNYWTNILAYP